MKKTLLLLVLFSLLAVLPAQAQENEIAVPDLSGMTIPQAASALNAIGLRIGVELSLSWDESYGVAQNVISAQSIEPGLPVAPGTSINIMVFRAANMRVIYDDNDLTLINLTDRAADLTRLRFVAASNTEAMDAWRLSERLNPRECAQVWVIVRSAPKATPDCANIQRWFTTNNPGEHFWGTQTGSQQFSVIESGVERTICPAAPVGSEASPLRCDFFFAGISTASDLSEFLYFTYTPESFALVNVTADHWMPTLISIYNFNPQLSSPGLHLTLGGPDVFVEEHRRGMGSIQQLAPEQCLVITTTGSENSALPQPCHIVAQRSLGAEVAFWLAPFEVDSVTNGRRFSCPAAVPEQPTVCIVPR